MATLQFCRQCGTSSETGTDFCRQCGLAVVPSNAAEQPADNVTQIDAPQSDDLAELQTEESLEMKCTTCEEKFARRDIYSPHGSGWFVRGMDPVCRNCVKARLQSGERVVDRGADWVSPGTVVLMIIGLIVLAEVVAVAATGYVFYAFGFMLPVIAYFLVRGLVNSFGPHGEFSPAGEMAALDYEQAMAGVRDGVRSGLSPADIEASRSTRSLVAGKSEVAALAIIAVAEERLGTRESAPTSAPEPEKVATPVS